MKLGISSYAYGWAIGFGDARPERPMGVLDLLQRAIHFEAQVLQVADNIAPEKLPEDQRAEVTKRAADHGMAIELGARRLTSERIETLSAIADEMGASLIRFLIDDEGYQPHLAEVTAVLRTAAGALPGHLRIAIENHDRFTAAKLQRLMEDVGSEQIGICLDVANSLGAGEGLETIVGRLRPWVLNLHMKDVSIRRIETLMGFLIEWLPCRTGKDRHSMGTRATNAALRVGGIRKLDTETRHAGPYRGGRSGLGGAQLFVLKNYLRGKVEPCVKRDVVFRFPWHSCVGTFVLGCNSASTSRTQSDRPVIGVAFETLQTEYWVAGFEAIKEECAKRGYDVIESVADQDANRQLQQVKNMITRGVDGIILVPKDAKTCGPMIRAANKANIPIVLFNRPADAPGMTSTAVVADNFNLAKQTTAYLIEKAATLPQPVKAMVLIGDLGDTNAINRRDGFLAAIDEATESGGPEIELVSRVPTEWNQEKAQAGVVNGLQANPDISLIFTSSDFLLPSIVSALQSAGKYHPIGHANHVLLGGFDGDATAFRMLKEGYLDATGVQDVYFEAQQCVEAVDELRSGKVLPELIEDPGFVIHQTNVEERKAQMWGAQQVD